MGKLKAIFASIGAGVVAVFYFLFKHYKSKSERLETENATMKTERAISDKVSEVELSGEKKRNKIRNMSDEEALNEWRKK